MNLDHARRAAVTFDGAWAKEFAVQRVGARFAARWPLAATGWSAVQPRIDVAHACNAGRTGRATLGKVVGPMP